MTRIRAFFLTAVVVVACNFSEHRAQAESAAARFHMLLNEGEFEEIYRSASNSFRGSGSRADFVAYVEAVRTTLGQFKTSETTFVNVNSTTSGTFVTLNLNSQFDQDAAAEEFTFVITDGQALLERYNINSKTLILK